ncbi:hypothetical protein CEXT_110421 [Caerostris extrusa]|uniref:Uncharacterized protein n=1 Tax=Caerostris extrusa TaxID=172846 RepID=A0AAV4ST29_CAEEX|nr:hypothetical protein CEXT_110421 [Caerostris extrusa]
MVDICFLQNVNLLSLLSNSNGMQTRQKFPCPLNPLPSSNISMTNNPFSVRLEKESMNFSGRIVCSQLGLIQCDWSTTAFRHGVMGDKHPTHLSFYCQMNSGETDFI